jgi:5-methylthioadenosine/S-adenosylhomocysteine deaminase
MATINGARAIGMADRIGSLKPGKRADLITVSSARMLSPFVCPLNEPAEVLWRRVRREDVCDVMVNGNLVVQGGRLLKIDVDDVEGALSKWYGELWAARGEVERSLSPILDEADLAVREFFGKYDLDALHSTNIYNSVGLRPRGL